MLFVPDDKAVTDALRYMKVPPSVRNDELIEIVRKTFEKLEKIITPRAVGGRFRVSHFDGGIEIEGAHIYSRDLERLTAKSDYCYIFAATLGHETDRRISLAQQENMLDGLAFDSCASVRIDSYCDYFVKSEIVPLLREGEYLTSRFSPGYGDLEMSVTEDILRILNAEKRIGLSLTRSLMMSPIKSVSAFIGLREKIQA